MPKETFTNLPSQKQENIIAGAIKEFAYKGFKNGNIGEIAKNVGVAKGSMYQYFHNKKELYLYCIQKAFETSLNYTKVDNYDNVAIYDYLIDSFKISWSFIHDHYEICLFIQNAAIESSKLNDESMDLMLKASEKFMIDLIEKNKKNGFIRVDIDTKIVMLYFEAVITKFKKEMLSIASKNNKGILDTKFEEYEYFISDMIKLLKTGMGKL
jgi:AcrR family transcriptional regulator